ncbi:MAG: nicotinate-nucleotide adenylyltransferase [Pseudomonadota bacterium]
MRTGFPKAAPGMRIGLLGGSFDPPHRGHVHITLRALKRLGLDRVWWLVSPGNPLKADAPAALARRMAAARQVMRHPRVEITDMEARLATRFTADTLKRMTACYPGVRFVWLMGADNMVGFHRWDQWQDILQRVPVAVMARPGLQAVAGLSPAARAFAGARLPVHAARILADRPPPAWVMVTGPMVGASSTTLRRAGHWVR